MYRTSGSIILSSVACVEPSAKLIWKEVDVRGFYCRLEPLDFRLRVCPSHEMSWYQVEVGAVNSTPIFFFFLRLQEWSWRRRAGAVHPVASLASLLPPFDDSRCD